MGMFDVLEVDGAETKQDNNGKDREITKVTMKMRSGSAGRSCCGILQSSFEKQNYESDKEHMKTVRVVAAVITACNENGERIIFAAQRGYGEFKDGWEFPGGKIEAGETPQDASKA